MQDHAGANDGSKTSPPLSDAQIAMIAANRKVANANRLARKARVASTAVAATAEGSAPPRTDEPIDAATAARIAASRKVALARRAARVTAAAAATAQALAPSRTGELTDAHAGANDGSKTSPPLSDAQIAMIAANRKVANANRLARKARVASTAVAATAEGSAPPRTDEPIDGGGLCGTLL